MGTLYITPVQGHYHDALCVFGESVYDNKIVFDNAELRRFILALALHNGGWQMNNGCVGFVVQVASEDGVVSETALLQVDSVMSFAKAQFEPLIEQENETVEPEGAVTWLVVADFIRYFVQSCWDNLVDDLDDFGDEAIVRSLEELLVCGNAPWGKRLFMQSVPIAGTDKNDPLLEVIVARELTFMDDSVLFLTPTGAWDTYTPQVADEVDAMVVAPPKPVEETPKRFLN